ncbi:MAG: hypothetical protein PIR53_19675 [Nocardioides alkalitolerans]
MVATSTETPERSAERSRSSGGALTGVLAAALLCVLVPFWLTTQSPGTPAYGLWFYGLGITIWAGLRLSILVSAGLPHLYGVIFWVFVYVFLGMAPIMQMRTGLLPNTIPNVDRSAVAPAFWIVIVGLICFEVGSYFGRKRGLSDGGSRRELAPDRVRWFAGLALLLGVAVLVQVGVAAHVADRATLLAARSAAFSGDFATLILASATVFPLVAVHAVFRVRRTQDPSLGRFGLGVAGAALFALVVFTVNPLTSARITFGTTLLSLAVLFGAIATAARVRLLIAALVAGMVLVFPLADISRGSSDDGVLSLATSGDYDAFLQVVNTYDYVGASGATWGNQILGSLLFFVPRSVWPGKPIDTGVLVADFQGFRFQNLSAPFWAEGYINFGWVGVVGFLALMGYLTARGDLHLAANLNAAGVLGLAGVVLPFFLLIILRGSMLQAMGQLAAFALAFLIISRRVDDKSPDEAQVGPAGTANCLERSGPDAV